MSNSLKEFEKALFSLKSKSGSRITAIGKLSVKYAEHYKTIVRMVEKYVKKSNEDMRLLAVYVIDSICRHSRARFGPKDKYAGRIGRKLESIFTTLVDCDDDQLNAIARVVGLWTAKKIFPEESISMARSLILEAKPDVVGLDGEGLKPKRDEKKKQKPPQRLSEKGGDAEKEPEVVVKGSTNSPSSSSSSTSKRAKLPERSALKKQQPKPEGAAARGEKQKQRYRLDDDEEEEPETENYGDGGKKDDVKAASRHPASPGKRNGKDGVVHTAGAPSTQGKTSKDTTQVKESPNVNLGELGGNEKEEGAEYSENLLSMLDDLLENDGAEGGDGGGGWAGGGGNITSQSDTALAAAKDDEQFEVDPNAPGLFDYGDDDDNNVNDRVAAQRKQLAEQKRMLDSMAGQKRKMMMPGGDLSSSSSEKKQGSFNADGVNEHDLGNLFARFGYVEDVTIKRAVGSVFVTMRDRIEAETAKSKCFGVGILASCKVGWGHGAGINRDMYDYRTGEALITENAFQQFGDPNLPPYEHPSYVPRLPKL
eukprot:jgi/Bigna1/142162/aug1.67_g16870